MTPLVACRRAEIADLRRRYHARRLEVFGSAGDDSGDFDPARSNADFLAAFDEAAGRSASQSVRTGANRTLEGDGLCAVIRGRIYGTSAIVQKPYFPSAQAIHLTTIKKRKCFSPL